MIRNSCSECGATRAPDQRYCLKCGARLGSLPAAISAQIGRVKKFATGRIPVVKAPAPEGPASKKKGWPFERSDFMPSPRAAAAAVIGMLALGVALGSVTNQLAQSAGLTTILLEESPPAEEGTVAETPPEPEAEASGEEPLPLEAASAAIPEEAPLLEEPLPSEPEPEPEPIPEEFPTGLPEVKHVFLIMLGEGGYEETFGEASTSDYLSKELPAQGELLPNYFAVTKGVPANQIALLSGQGPTPETQAGCPNYADVIPGTESEEGQVEGNGCIYPAATKTLPGQMAEKELTWRAYVDEESSAEGEQPPGCYVTSRNPFAYFHSITDSEECDEADAGLAQLAKDLTLKPEKFPALAYISPDPAIGEETLKTVIPNIEESFAYKDGGLIVITSAQAKQEGEAPDASACCITPDYPNLEEPESEEPVTGPVRKTGGGGQVGALLISPFIEPGTSSETYFNHYSLLVSLEELFGLERIGYAAEPALAGFDETIFNAAG